MDSKQFIEKKTDKLKKLVDSGMTYSECRLYILELLVEYKEANIISIGDYKAQQIDKDCFTITKEYDNPFLTDPKVKVSGGDLETLLSVLFINSEKT